MGLGSTLKKAVKGVTKALNPETIFNAGVSILGDVLGNRANEKAQKDQQEFDLKMWNLQNEYNTPANQVARLRAAGLNPNLFYGQGNVGNATSAPTTQAVRYSYDFAKAIDKAALAEQVKNMRVQNENLLAQNRNINATTRSIDLENELKVRDLELYRKYGLLPRGSLPQQVVKYGKDLLDGFPRYSLDTLNWFMKMFVDKNYHKNSWSDIVVHDRK